MSRTLVDFLHGRPLWQAWTADRRTVRVFGGTDATVDGPGRLRPRRMEDRTRRID